MKKFLFLLVFASLGAGLSAQDLRLSGALDTGAVLFFPGGKDEEGEYQKPTISLWSTQEGAAARMALNGTAANKDGTAGVNFQIRAYAPFSQSSNSLYFENARGWLKFFDKKLTVFGGKLDDNGVLRTFGGIDEDTMAKGDLGLHARLEGILFSNLTLGVTVMPGVTGQLNYTNTLERGAYRFGARYLIPERLGIVGLWYNNSQTEIYEHDRVHMFYGFDILALRGLGFAALRADFGFYDMQDSDYSNMKTGQLIVMRKGPLEIGGRFRQSFLIGEMNSKSGYTPELLFRVYGTAQAAGGKVRPRLELGYLYGGYKTGTTSPNMRFNAYEAVNPRRSTVDPTQQAVSNRVRGFEEDSGYLVVLPQCEFRAGSSSITIGGGPLYDLTWSEQKQNYMLFVNLHAAF